MNVDELLSHYERGVMTRDELFGYLTEILSLDELVVIRVALAARDDLENAFRPWIESVERGAETVAAGQSKWPSAEARKAARAWRQIESAPGRFKRVVRHPTSATEYPIGTEALLLEMRNAEGTRWLVEVRDPENAGRCQHLELPLEAIDVTRPLSADMEAADLIPVDADHSLGADVALRPKVSTTPGSRELPRTLAAA